MSAGRPVGLLALSSSTLDPKPLLGLQRLLLVML